MNVSERYRGGRIGMTAAAMTGALLFGLAAVPAGAATAADAQTATAPAAPASAAGAARTTRRGVDGLIAHLHDTFKITPDQEAAFGKLAEVMRSDAEQMRTLSQKRAESAKTASAVDDLKSYADISTAHADGIRKMIPAFEALYATFSPAQKAAADQEFRQHYAPGHHHHGR